MEGAGGGCGVTEAFSLHLESILCCKQANSFATCSYLQAKMKWADALCPVPSIQVSTGWGVLLPLAGLWQCQHRTQMALAGNCPLLCSGSRLCLLHRETIPGLMFLLGHWIWSKVHYYITEVCLLDSKAFKQGLEVLFREGAELHLQGTPGSLHPHPSSGLWQHFFRIIEWFWAGRDF